MKTLIVCVLLGVLIGIMPPLLSAQQSQNTQKSSPEIEAFKQRVSEIEKQLQIVENVEKMDLQAKLANANAKLANVQFDKFKLNLRVDNDDRMRAWSYWFFSILGIFVVISGAVIGFLLKTLIANNVEKNLKGFKQALEEQNTIKNEFGELAKAHAANVLWGIDYSSVDDTYFSGEIKVLSEESLLQLFQDKKFHQDIRCKAAKVLATRKSPRLVSPFLEFLNSVVDSDLGIYEVAAHQYLRPFSYLLGRIPTLEAFEGITLFLNRLLKDNPRHKDLFLTGTAFSLTEIGLQLNRGSSVAILRKAIPGLNLPGERDGPIMIARYFERYNELDGIKEILTYHGKDLTSDVVDKCLELLEKHDPEFVEEWRTQKAADEVVS